MFNLRRDYHGPSNEMSIPQRESRLEQQQEHQYPSHISMVGRKLIRHPNETRSAPTQPNTRSADAVNADTRSTHLASADKKTHLPCRYKG